MPTPPSSSQTSRSKRTNRAGRYAASSAPRELPPEVDAVAVGERLAQARSARGLSREQVAEALSVSVRSVQDYELGTAIPWRYLPALEELLARPYVWLLTGLSLVPDRAADAEDERRFREDVLARLDALAEAVRLLTLRAESADER